MARNIEASQLGLVDQEYQAPTHSFRKLSMAVLLNINGQRDRRFRGVIQNELPVDKINRTTYVARGTGKIHYDKKTYPINPGDNLESTTGSRIRKNK